MDQVISTSQWRKGSKQQQEHKKEVTQWRVALSKTQRFGLKDASSFTGSALILCIQQFKEDNSVKNKMDQFLLDIASMALSADLFADDISLALFPYHFQKYKLLQKDIEGLEAGLVRGVWGKICENCRSENQRISQW